MIKKTLFIYCATMVLLCFYAPSGICSAISNYEGGAVFQNFDNFIPTQENAKPEDSTDWWIYSSNKTTKSEYVKSSGWFNSTTYRGSKSVFDFIAKYGGYNNAHMGFDTFGYLEIEEEIAVKGNSLKFVATGGYNSLGIHGKKISSKEDYLDYVRQGIDPYSRDGKKVGHPYLYFMNSSMNQGNVPFQQVKSKNRLSFYIRMPEDVTNNGSPPHSPQPSNTISIGPYTGTGGHWYHDVYNRGGGWTHVLIDGHPNHNNAFHNASIYPYPSSSVRDMGISYFDKMYAFYITFSPYEGIAVPPYQVLFDEIEFYYDDEPQNSETINTPSVTFHNDSLNFEIGFSDKYKNNKDSWSEYEVKYSFSQITNNNYDAAEYVIILEDSRFKGVSYNEKGFFKKVWPYYQAVWAPFKLKEADQKKLAPGVKVYFAVKDLSTRPYDKGTFDQEGDTAIVPNTGGKRRIDLIKRIDYLIPKDFIVPQNENDNDNGVKTSCTEFDQEAETLYLPCVEIRGGISFWIDMVVNRNSEMEFILDDLGIVDENVDVSNEDCTVFSIENNELYIPCVRDINDRGDIWMKMRLTSGEPVAFVLTDWGIVAEHQVLN